MLALCARLYRDARSTKHKLPQKSITIPVIQAILHRKHTAPPLQIPAGGCHFGNNLLFYCAKRINTLCGLIAELQNVKAGGGPQR
jgi:hypothetical protein